MGKHKRPLSSSSSSESRGRRSRSSSSRSSSSSPSRDNRRKKYSRDDRKKNDRRKESRKGSRRDRSRSKSISRSPKRRHERRGRDEDRKPRRERSRDRDRSKDRGRRDELPERNEREEKKTQNGRADRRPNPDEEIDQNIPEDYRDDRRPPRPEETKEGEAPIEVEKPCFEPSGILAKYANTVNGVVLKFTEPPEAKKPDLAWKVFPFRGDEEFPVIPIFRQSCYLFGKDSRVADVLIEHPTCSGQHAVIQFREIPKQDQNGEYYTVIKPYLMDLESTNGTFLNGEQIEPARYYELLPSDVIKFGKSTREYVVMREDVEVHNESDSD